jgi:hypothetical protein
MPQFVGVDSTNLQQRRILINGKNQKSKREKEVYG